MTISADIATRYSDAFYRPNKDYDPEVEQLILRLLKKIQKEQGNNKEALRMIGKYFQLNFPKKTKEILFQKKEFRSKESLKGQYRLSQSRPSREKLHDPADKYAYGIAAIPLLKGYFKNYLGDDRKAAINRLVRKGREHAQLAAKEAEANRIKYGIKPAFTEPVKVRVQLKKLPANELALYVNGEAFHHLRGSKFESQNSTGSSFLAAHDVLRHLFSDRTFASNITTVAGEHGTGQVPNLGQLLPTSNAQYDGLISAQADYIQREEFSSENSAFRSLEALINKFRFDKSIKPGSSLDLDFEIPPSDITLIYDMDAEPVNRKYILGSKQDYGFVEPADKEAFVEKIKDQAIYYDDVKSSDNIIGSGEKRKYYMPAEAGEDREVYTVLSVSGKVILIQKSYQTTDGKEILETEKKLRTKDYKLSTVGGDRYYIKASEKMPGHEVLVACKPGKVSTVLLQNLSEYPFKYAYTGMPYQERSITDISIKAADGEELDIDSGYQDSFTLVQEGFSQHQRLVRGILTGGTLLPDKRVLEDTFDDHKKPLIDLVDAMSLPWIQDISDLFDHLANQMNSTFHQIGSKGTSTFRISPFPPPPAK